MKNILVLFSLVFSNSLAWGLADSEYIPVAPEQVESYKNQIRDALNENPKLMGVCQPQWVYNTLHFATEIFKHPSSGQPLVLADAYYSNHKRMNRLAVTTDNSLKKIIQIDAETYEVRETNTGDLANPVIEKELILIRHVSCTR